MHFQNHSSQGINFHTTSENIRSKCQTSRGIGYSSDSSMRTTWLIFGLFSESGSTHLNAVKRARLRALVEGLVSMLGSNTSSERLNPTIILSQSTKFTCKKQQKIVPGKVQQVKIVVI